MSILFTILALILGTVAAMVVLSYAFVWYEYANHDPELMQDRFTLSRLWLAAWLIGTETAFLLLTVLVHPLGWFKTNGRAVSDATATPIILLHGLFHNRACWFWTKHRLRRRGFQSLHTINLPPWYDVETLTERVAKKVDELRHATGVEKVHLIGHSMGGMIARNYLQVRGGAQKVERCILLSSPNAGSKLAPFSLTPLGKILLPGSEFLQRLAAAPLPEGVRLTAIVNCHDNMVLPFENARLEGARNIELAGMGHASVLYHPRSLGAIVEALSEALP